MQNNKAGFTLVELAIVLVVIGLLLGMAFKGKSLIDAAKIKSDLTKIDKISTAFNVYYSKYNVLPGKQADGKMQVKDVYDALIKENLLKQSDFKVAIQSSVGASYWVFSGCKDEQRNGKRYWKMTDSSTDDGVCVFRSTTPPWEFTSGAFFTSTAFVGKVICQIETSMDDKNLYSGDGRVADPSSGDDTGDFGPTDVDPNWDCSNENTNAGQNLKYAFRVF